MALDFDAAERWAAAGCATPGCSHDTHDEVYLHARCHPAARVRVTTTTGEVEVSCLTCSRPVATLSISTEPDSSLLAQFKCCTHRGKDARYRPGKGLLEIVCPEHETVLLSFKLAGAP